MGDAGQLQLYSEYRRTHLLVEVRKRIRFLWLEF